MMGIKESDLADSPGSKKQCLCTINVGFFLIILCIFLIKNKIKIKRIVTLISYFMCYNVFSSFSHRPVCYTIQGLHLKTHKNTSCLADFLEILLF